MVVVAEFIGGIGMSHSSLVALPDAEFWRAHASIDRRNPHLRDKHGEALTFDELQRRNGDQPVPRRHRWSTSRARSS